MAESRPRIVITRRLPSPVEAALAARYDAVPSVDDRQLDAEGLQRALADADGIVATITDRFTAEVLAAYPIRARIIANFGAGTDHIDLPAAWAHEITVTNTPGALTEATAELTLTLMLMAARRAGEGERDVRSGRWTGWAPTYMLGQGLQGRTLGLIGTGRIATAVARRAAGGLGMTVTYHNPRRPAVDALDRLGARGVSLEELLATSDVVSLHCPSTPDTRNLIDAARIASMRPGAILVNTARGDVIDDDAVVAALASGHLGAVGLDVYRGEPRLDPRYLAFENAVLLPHLGSATVATRVAMGEQVLRNLDAFFAGEAPPDLVTPR